MTKHMESIPQFVTVERFEKLTGFLEKLSKRLDAIEKSIKGIDQRIGKIEDYLDSIESESSTDDSTDASNYGFGPKPPPSIRHPSGESYTVELSYGPHTVHRRAEQDDADWVKTKRHLMSQRIQFLNCSGVSGTPEQIEWKRESDERWARWVKDGVWTAP
jgi:hypothetical protein